MNVSMPSLLKVSDDSDYGSRDTTFCEEDWEIKIRGVCLSSYTTIQNYRTGSSFIEIMIWMSPIYGT